MSKYPSDGIKGEWNVSIIESRPSVVSIKKGIYEVARMFRWTGSENDIEGVAEEIAHKLKTWLDMKEALEEVCLITIREQNDPPWSKEYCDTCFMIGGCTVRESLRKAREGKDSGTMIEQKSQEVDALPVTVCLDCHERVHVNTKCSCGGLNRMKERELTMGNFGPKEKKNMKGHMIADWSKVDLAGTEGQRQFVEAVQYFMDLPRIASEEIRTRAAEFTNPGDLPGLIATTDDITRLHQVEDPDVGWMGVFDVIDFTDTRKNGFDLIDVSFGLTFRSVKPGEKAEVYKVSGEKVSVDFDLYGGALGWSRLWFDDEEYWKIEDVAKEFRNRWYANKTQAHYDLISASRPDKDMSWREDDGDTQEWRDVQTINCACESILLDTTELGYDVSENSTFVVLVPAQLLGRIRHSIYMFKPTFNVRLIPTTRLRNQALDQAEMEQYIVALPGRKIKSGNRMDLTILSEQDILAYAETVAGWGRFGACVGEIKQLRRCATK